MHSAAVTLGLLLRLKFGHGMPRGLRRRGLLLRIPRWRPSAVNGYSDRGSSAARIHFTCAAPIRSRSVCLVVAQRAGFVATGCDENSRNSWIPRSRGDRIFVHRGGGIAPVSACQWKSSTGPMFDQADNCCRGCLACDIEVGWKALGKRVLR